MNRRRFIEASAVGAVVGVAGCVGGMSGGGDGNGSGGDAMGETTVTMSGTDFEPRILRVDSGATVTWTNDGTAAHTVKAESLTDAGADWSFTSDQLGSGESATFTFEESGAYEYFCTIHGDSTMCGVVLVGDVDYGATLPCEESSGGVY